MENKWNLSEAPTFLYFPSLCVCDRTDCCGGFLFSVSFTKISAAVLPPEKEVISQKSRACWKWHFRSVMRAGSWWKQISREEKGSRYGQCRSLGLCSRCGGAGLSPEQAGKNPPLLQPESAVMVSQMQSEPGPASLVLDVKSRAQVTSSCLWKAPGWGTGHSVRGNAVREQILHSLLHPFHLDCHFPLVCCDWTACAVTGGGKQGFVV